MGYFDTSYTSEAISDLFEIHDSLTCFQIEEYCLKHKCFPEAYNGMGKNGKPEDMLRQLIDFSIDFLRGDLHPEFTEAAIEPFDMTGKQKKALKVFMSSENPDYDTVYQIKFRKTDAWKNEKLPSFKGYDA